MRFLRALAKLFLLAPRLIRALARFSFVDGREYIRFPSGTIHRAGKREYEKRKDERKARQKNGSQKEAKAAKEKTDATDIDHWKKQMHAMREGDLDRRVPSE